MAAADSHRVVRHAFTSNQITAYSWPMRDARKPSREHRGAKKIKNKKIYASLEQRQQLLQNCAYALCQHASARVCVCVYMCEWLREIFSVCECQCVSRSLSCRSSWSTCQRPTVRKPCKRWVAVSLPTGWWWPNTTMQICITDTIFKTHTHFPWLPVVLKSRVHFTHCTPLPLQSNEFRYNIYVQHNVVAHRNKFKYCRQAWIITRNYERLCHMYVGLRVRVCGILMISSTVSPIFSDLRYVHTFCLLIMCFLHIYKIVFVLKELPFQTRHLKIKDSLIMPSE